MEPKSWEESRLYRDWHRAVAEGNPNDFLMCVTAGSRTGVSGTGKSTLLTYLAKKTDRSPEGYNAEEKSTLDAGELAYDLAPDLPSGSALVGDEMQGAPGTTGFDKRRGMQTEVVDGISSILANRDKQYTIILGAQMIQMLDLRLIPMIDAWLLIRYQPDHPKGPLATYHTVGVQDYKLKTMDLQTPGLEDFRWPKVPHDDPDYCILEEKKQEAKRKRSSGESNGKNPLEERNERIKKAYASGVPQGTIAEIFDLTQPMVSNIVNGKA